MQRRLRRDITYEVLSKKVSDGNFTHTFVVPPGGTFTSALRGNTPSEVYGWKSIPAVDKNKVRIETLLVIRATEIITKISLFRKILRQSPRLRELLVLLVSSQSTPEKQEGLSAELDTLLVSARECLAKVLRCSDTE